MAEKPCFFVKKSGDFTELEKYGTNTVPRELVPQVISVPYDPSCVQYEAKPAVHRIPLAEVKQECIHSNISQGDTDLSDVPIISGAPMPVCPKIEILQAKKQKESFIFQGTKDKENKPALVACSTLVSIQRHEDVSDLVARFG